MSLDTFGDVNYLAVLVAAVAYSALGALWYSPPLFGRAWMEATGIRPQEGASATPLYILSFVAWFIVALGLAFLAREAGAETYGDGILLGLVTGVGFLLTTFAVTFAFESRPRIVYYINIGYNIVGFLVAAVIVTVWD
jgi:hypothetical protein